MWVLYGNVVKRKHAVERLDDQGDLITVQPALHQIWRLWVGQTDQEVCQEE